MTGSTIFLNQIKKNQFLEPTLTYLLNKQSAVSVKMFDLNGKLTAVLLDEIQNEGEQYLDAGVSNLSKGIYFVILNAEGLKTAKRLVIQ